MALTAANPLSIAASTLNALDFQLALTAGNLSLKNVSAANPFRAEINITAVDNLTAAGAVSSNAGTNFPIGTDIVKGIQVMGTQRMIAQGPQIDTPNPYDVMISATGYYAEIEYPGSASGKAYKRELQLKIDRNRQLVTKEGYIVAPGIIIPQDAQQVQLNQNGTWTCVIPGQDQPQELGQMTLVRFASETALKPRDQNLYMETAESGAAEAVIPGQNGAASFIQYAYEGSTIDSSEQLIKLVEISKDYAYVVKVIERWDESTKQVAQAA